MHKLRVDEGEIRKIGLVDVGDDQLVRGRELGLRAREELVKVLCCFATLEKRDTGEGLRTERAPKLRAPRDNGGGLSWFHTQSGRVRDVH